MMRVGYGALGPALLLLVLASALPAVARVVEVYQARHRIALELAPLVETVLGADGRVVADPRTNSLVITGEADAVEDALALLSSIDRRMRTVVLRSRSEDAASLASQGIHVDWRIDAGDLRVGTMRGPAKRAGTRIGIELDASETRRSGEQSAMLRILEGETGRIASGTTAPLTSREILPTPRGPAIRETTQLISAESGIEARPRVLGDGRIELSLRSFHDRLGPEGRIETASAETRVVVSPGETIALGSLAGSEQAERRDLLSGAGRDTTSTDRVLLITVTVE